MVLQRCMCFPCPEYQGSQTKKEHDTDIISLSTRHRTTYRPRAEPPWLTHSHHSRWDRVMACKAFLAIQSKSQFMTKMP